VTSDRTNLCAQDPRSVWAERLADKRDAGFRIVDGKRARLLSAAYWGVALGDDCAFYGRIRRVPASGLAIGERCVFRSSVWSNQVGLNRTCMLSTPAAGAELRVERDCGLSGTVLAAAETIVLEDRRGLRYRCRERGHVVRPSRCGRCGIPRQGGERPLADPPGRRVIPPSSRTARPNLRVIGESGCQVCLLIGIRPPAH